MLHRFKPIISNKYLIVGMLFSVIAIGLFSMSASLFFEHQKCTLVWNDKHRLPPYMGGQWCGDELVVLSHNFLILGVGMSSVTITMLVIYFKKW